ncbi:Lar family restriction alleviation protein [uncultured Senegalimassilia sp.]|uniref:Lar family restriction alleviation protein n=1 Tax=uncultured Senegalimassilia sp. TaxID=1714350 RepID=UPI002621F674|nr:Lar family restriction alleviation protein [uncultured Senegalimassilia sp.]
MMIDLKPCPFCGGKPLAIRDGDDGGLTIKCPKCSKMWDHVKPSERWASDFGFYGWDESSDGAVIAAWNRRAVISSMCHVVVEEEPSDER